MVYWIRRCIHNYSDTIASNMLRIIADAMHEDSRLLIVEAVKENPPSAETAATDILMVSCGGKERTLDEWKSVTARAGLKISSVGDGLGSWGKLAVIECIKTPPADGGVGAGGAGAVQQEPEISALEEAEVQEEEGSPEDSNKANPETLNSG